MPNPNDPDEHECRRCRDTGLLGDDSLCPCVSGRHHAGEMTGPLPSNVFRMSDYRVSAADLRHAQGLSTAQIKQAYEDGKMVQILEAIGLTEGTRSGTTEEREAAKQLLVDWQEGRL